MENVVCKGCNQVSPIPAYVVAPQFGNYCLQCWKIVQQEYFNWLANITPTYGINGEVIN